MKVKKVIKKIVALSAGLSMMGATMFGAMAADLADFPAPFIKDGMFNGKIVIGEASDPSDVIGAIDVGARLQFEAKTTETVSGGDANVQLSGDSYKLAKSTNKLELNELLTSIASNVIKSDMIALADGEITNEFADHDYTQTIEISPTAYVTFARVDDDYINEQGLEDVPTPYLLFPQDQNAYVYKVAFSPNLKSDHSTSGTAHLEDIRNKKITLLGQQYTILKADHPSVNSIKLTLMAGAISDILEEGMTKTYTLEGTEYEVTASIITTSEVKFIINTEVTDALTEGDTFKLKDGTEIGVIDIMENEAGEAAGGDKVDFNLGANKIVLEDTATTTADYGGTVTVGSEELDNVKLDIITSQDAGTAHGADVKISDIKVRYRPSDNLYIPAGHKLSAVADEIEDEEGNIFLDGFDIEFGGLEIGNTEEIKLKPSGSNNYKLEWTNKNGQRYNQEVFSYTSGGSIIALGERSGSTDRSLKITESAPISKTTKDFFIVTKNGYSHIMQFTGSTYSSSKNETKLKDVAGETYTVSMSSQAGNATGDLNLDGNTFKIHMTDVNTIYVDMNGDGTIGTASVANAGLNSATAETTTACTGTASSSTGLVTQYEACLSFGSGNDTVYLTTTKTENTKYNTTAMAVRYDTSSSNNRLTLNGTTTGTWDFGGTGGLQNEDEKEYMFMDMFGVRGTWEQPSSAAHTFTWTYPEDQVTAAVFYTSGVTETTSTAGGETTTDKIVRIGVGMAVFDSDPSVKGKFTTQNIIAIGGPAINQAAAALLGVPFPSFGAASTIPENSAIIKLVENGDNVGLVVAGWTAADSQRAARVVADFDKYAGFKGTEIQVSGTSFTDISVSAVTSA